MIYGASLLHAKIAAVCPIDGVAIGDPNDVKTWRIDFAVGASSAQIVAAQQALVAITPASLIAADTVLQQAAAALPDPLATARALSLAGLPSPLAV